MWRAKALHLFRNKCITGTAQVEQFGDAVGEPRLMWFGRVQRRVSGYFGQRVLNIEEKQETTEKIHGVLV